MGKIMLNEIDYSGGNANVIRLTQAEYDALPPSKLTDNNVYMITDANGDGSQFQPVIYSEDEREIGVWVDGKPLYEKTIRVYPLTKNGADIYFNHNIANIDIVCGYKGFFCEDPESLGRCTDKNTDTNTQYVCSFFDANRTQIGYAIGAGWNYQAAYIILQYTKTTDTAGSGTWTPQGVPAVHYSTDEQVVGTWVDGSTIYEKTYSTTFTNGSTTCDIAFSDILNLNSIIDLKGILDNAVPFTLNGINGNVSNLSIVSLHQYGNYGYLGSNGIRLQRSSAALYGDTPPVIVTIRYTKIAV